MECLFWLVEEDLRSYLWAVWNKFVASVILG
jgi:hypothetical protein